MFKLFQVIQRCKQLFVTQYCVCVFQHPSLAIVKAAGLIMKAIIEVNITSS